jgi:hypothetical protein
MMFTGVIALLVIATGTQVAHAEERKCSGTLGAITVNNQYPRSRPAR